MAESLFIRVGEPGGDSASIVLDTDGRVVRAMLRGTLDDVARDADGRRVVLLVPGPEVLTARITLPPMSPARLRQTLPFAFEDQLAEDVDALHFASGTRTSTGELTVAAVSRARLDHWLAELDRLGLKAAAVYADSDGVPDTPGSLTLIVDGERIYTRWPDSAPVALEGVGVAEAYELISADNAGTADVRHADIYVSAAAGDAVRADAAALAERIGDADVRVLGDGVLGRLATTLLFNAGTNLLQGRYTPETGYSALARPWYAAAGLAAGLAAIAILAQGTELIVLGGERRALDDYLTAACDARFSTTSLTRCGNEADRLLSEAGMTEGTPGETFLSALATIARHHDAAGRIESLSYRNRVMSLQLTAADVPNLDRLAQAIESTERFDVRIQSVNARGDGVEGRLQLVEAGR